MHEREKVFQYEEGMGMHKDDIAIFLYVYDDKTELWNRAREETLRNAACDKLYTYVTGVGK